MWTIAWYAPVGLFSLKAPFATTAGAKSLLVPTPYALRMALLDAYLRSGSRVEPESFFRLLRSAKLAVAPPEHACVSNVFTKQLRPTRDGGSEESFQKTIAFREYVFQDGLLGVAISGEVELSRTLFDLLPGLDYLGKRGSFVQWRPPIEETEDLDDRFVSISESPASFSPSAAMQILDDCEPDLEFDDVSIYSGKRTRRRRLHIPVRYRRVHATRNYTYYRWAHDDASP
jgi:hypothetical protein